MEKLVRMPCTPLYEQEGLESRQAENLTPFRRRFLALSPPVQGYLELWSTMFNPEIEKEARIRIGKERKEQLEIIKKEPKMQAELISFFTYMSSLEEKRKTIL